MPTHPFTLALRRLVARQGISLTEIAKRGGLGRNSLHRHLSGWYPEPNYSTIKKLAKGLGVEPWDFFGWDEAEEIAIDDDLFELLQVARGLSDAARYRLLTAALAEQDTQEPI